MTSNLTIEQKEARAKRREKRESVRKAYDNACRTGLNQLPVQHHTCRYSRVRGKRYADGTGGSPCHYGVWQHSMHEKSIGPKTYAIYSKLRSKQADITTRNAAGDITVPVMED